MTKESIQMITKMESNIYDDVLLEAEMSYQTLLIFWRKFTKIFKCVLLLQKQFLFYFLLSLKKCVCKKGFLCEVLYVNYVKIQQVAAEELQFDQDVILEDAGEKSGGVTVPVWGAEEGCFQLRGVKLRFFLSPFKKENKKKPLQSSKMDDTNTRVSCDNLNDLPKAVMPCNYSFLLIFIAIICDTQEKKSLKKSFV